MDPTAPTPKSRPGIRQLFESLIELDEAARTQRLRELQLDTQRLQQLQALLSADGRGLPLLAAAPADVAQRWKDGALQFDKLLGRQIGTFRLTDLLGYGGSASVFRAERAVGDVTQVVALKLLRGGLFTPDAERRFGREQGILAQLTHPNIARLIEAGVAEPGLPYIAMELVEGAAITVQADAQALSLRARIGLMITLCRAIDAAHAALVVHRDLKPSNVFMDRYGVVKVLDFGIAKLLDEDPLQTQTQAIMLTPEYAAPEQFKPGPITVAADIYALGVLLGELLTGRLLGGGNTQRASAFTKTDSDQALPRGLPVHALLVRQLRGDLDAIIATALAEEPLRRYRSAGLMADDLQRYLEGRPVQAHPPSRWYRARKFVQRHRGGVVITALLLVGILSSLLLALWQADVARRSATEAKAEAARANALRAFMLDAFAEAEPSTPGADSASVIDVVERAIQTATSQSDTMSRDKVELLFALAVVVQKQGALDRANELLTELQSRALPLLDPQDYLLLEIELELIKNLSDRGLKSAARERIDQLLVRIPPDDLATRINALKESASIASGVEYQRERAVQDSREALGLARQYGDPDFLQSSLTGHAVALLAASQVAEAVVIFEEDLKINRQRYGDSDVHVANSLASLARAYRRLGKLDQAERSAREAIQIDQAVYRGPHPNVLLHRNALYMILQEQRRFDEALQIQVENIRSLEASANSKPSDDLAVFYSGLAQLQWMLGDYASAVQSSHRTLDEAIASGSDNGWTGVRYRANLGYSLALAGQVAAGIAELEKTQRMADELPTPIPGVLAMLLERRIRVALSVDDIAAAQALLPRFAEQCGKIPPADAVAGRVGTLRGEVLWRSRDVRGAKESLEDTEAEFRSERGKDELVITSHSVLRALVAAEMKDAAHVDELTREAHRRFSTLKFPPPSLQRLAADLRDAPGGL
jgi:eukaryotic-like serine/threonine-protein kinase